MCLKSWTQTGNWTKVSEKLSVGRANTALTKQIRTYAKWNAVNYPYVTDAYQESKPLMRALHNAQKTNVLWQLGGVIAAVTWKQGPRELLFGNWGVSTPFTITGVEVVKNASLYNEFQKGRFFVGRKHRKRPKVPVEDHDRVDGPLPSFPVVCSKTKEVFLFAGFSSATLDKILDGGYRPDLGAYDGGYFGRVGGKGHGALGRGAYFSDRISKAISYTPCPSCNLTAACESGCNSPPRRLLLNRVVLGTAFMVESGSDLRHAHHNDMVRDSRHEFGSSANKKIDAGVDKPLPKPRKGGKYHSIIGLATKQQGKGGISALFTTAYFDSDEYLVRNADQVYPEFVISFTVP